MSLLQEKRTRPVWLYVLTSLVSVVIGGALVLGLLWGNSRLLQQQMPFLGLIQKPSEVDIGFVQSMSRHHDQAITLAQIAERKGGIWVRQFAQGVVLKQLTEMGVIAGWLGVWGAPVLPADTRMAWLEKGNNPNAPVDALYLQRCRAVPGMMPGMFTMEQINALQALNGVEFDRRFLAMMIEHHQGAVPMAQFAWSNAQSYLVRSMANTIVREQSIEVVLMGRVLKGL